MEDLLVWAQSGKVRLSTTRIDALLRASDALRQLSEGVSVQGLPALQAILAEERSPQARNREASRLIVPNAVKEDTNHVSELAAYDRRHGVHRSP
jgi:chemotaxis protein histidine kinase CheA